MITLMMSVGVVLVSSATCGGEACQVLNVAAIAASHHGSYDGRELTWHSHIVAEDGELVQAGTYRVTFASPLDVAAEVVGEGLVDVRSVRDAQGRVVAVEVPRVAWSEPMHRSARAWTRDLSLTIREPVATRPSVPVTVPLVEGLVVQKVIVSGTDGLDFEPDPTLGIEQHLRHFVANGIPADERSQCDRLLGEHEILPRQLAVYLRADRRVHETGMVVGRLAPVGPHRHRVALVAVGGTVFLVGLLALGYRLLARAARFERLVALVDADLKQPASPRPGSP